MTALINALISVIAISLISFIGIVSFSIRLDKLKKVLIYMVSFSAGALFGGAFLHLLPEAVSAIGFSLSVSASLLAGIVVFFILEKIVHWHHCHDIECSQQPKHIAYMNLIGDAVHNFIDGLIIGAAYAANIASGISITIAVVLHEIPQEIGDFGVLVHGGFSRKKALFSNFLIALTSVLGVLASFVIASQFEAIMPLLLPFAAGGFIYIAGTDLIPELHKETKLKNSVLQLIVFILGIAVMSGLLLLE